MADSNIQSSISVLRFLLSVLLSLIDWRIAGRRVFFLLKTVWLMLVLAYLDQ